MFLLASATTAFQVPFTTTSNNNNNHGTALQATPSRRSFLATSAAVGAAALSAPAIQPVAPANAIGPVKLDLKNPTYFAEPCPPSKPIPGEKAMKGLRGLCVTVKAELGEIAPKDLEKVGVYGFVRDGDELGDSVLANNPDLNSDAGQFAMIESITTKDTKVEFEFIAAIPKERDISGFENGIGPLKFQSLRIVSFPGGQQYGAISPCEMNEFSDECEAWIAENGEYVKADYMVKSNDRTKGR